MPNAGSLGQVVLSGSQAVKVCAKTGARRAEAPKSNVPNCIVALMILKIQSNEAYITWKIDAADSWLKECNAQNCTGKSVTCKLALEGAS